VFLALLIANMVGGYMYFVVRAVQIKQEMRTLLKSLPEEDLELLVLSPEEYMAARVDDHEVKVEGKMYDIARVEAKDGLLYVYCIHDEAEDSLLGFLDVVLMRIQNDTTSPPNAISQFSMLQFLATDFDYQCILSTSACVNETPYHFIHYCSEHSIELPPPRT
jgi:hypothetical protein